MNSICTRRLNQLNFDLIRSCVYVGAGRFDVSLLPTGKLNLRVRPAAGESFVFKEISSQKPRDQLLLV